MDASSEEGWVDASSEEGWVDASSEEGPEDAPWWADWFWGDGWFCLTGAGALWETSWL